MQQEPGTSEAFPAELLATVGHEFRGPLTTIQGYATTLLRHEQQLTLEERQEFLRAISEASTHLGRLIDRFLELAQLESHIHAFNQVPVDLLALVQESLTALRKHQPRHVLLTPSPLRGNFLEEDTRSVKVADEWTLLGDRRLLRMLVDLLLENAVAYSAPESLIEVSIDALDADSVQAFAQASAGTNHHQVLVVAAAFEDQERALVLRVRDHGIGIEPAHLGLIFQRFYRVDTSLTRTVNGLGLGLALCKAIVILHGGQLQVESVVGEGTTFSIVLPCGRAAESRP